VTWLAFSQKLGLQSPKELKPVFPANRCPSNAEALNGSPQEQINKLNFLKIYREAIPQFYILHFDF